LSPRLVEAIAKTTQVVWANSRKQEGLIGRSDIRLQTAVGMPVAVDDLGNMCIVVMFSPNNICSSDDAMEYLQSISRCATTSSIPGLLPAFDPKASHTKQLTYAGPHVEEQNDVNAFGDGVTTRYVSLDQNADTEIHNVHELTDAPKDTFGIPMLPMFAEIGTVSPEVENELEIFDEASYGIWTTIMDTLNDDNLDVSFGNALDYGNSSTGSSTTQNDPASALRVSFADPAAMSESRKVRLEEFCSAFLEMSVFDVADVWIPAGEQYPDCLRHVTSVSSSDKNTLLDDFRTASSCTLIKYWTGAIGRAFSSGNPVWSANQSVFIDRGRAHQFESAKIMTVLAVPVFSGKSVTPTCVVACYSLVKSGSVPFVLRFVQSALRLLWDGLDNVEPHESVGKHLWQDIAPADLGEMAADIEMQHHFMVKKRPRTYSMSQEPENHVRHCPTTTALASHLEAVRLPNGESAASSIETSTVPQHAPSPTNDEMQRQLYEAIRSAALNFPYDDLATADNQKRAPEVPLRPLPLPHRFPTTIVSSDQSVSSESSRSESEQTKFTTAVFFVPNQNVRMMEINQTTNQDAEPFANMDFSSMIQPNQFCVPTDDNDTTSQESYGEPTQCRIVGCNESATSRRPYCIQHSGNRLCERQGCNKCAQGSTRFCIAHGGGRRCTAPGCDKGARDKFFCAAHGGGKRCSAVGCIKSAVGGSSLCTSHGGGRRCSIEGCNKSAQSSTNFCVKHGGGKKCSQDGCEKVARGRTPYCAAHGGGVRCVLDGCNRVAIGKMQLCRAHGGGSTLRRNRGPINEHHTPVVATIL
jgi:hypothetical protein